MLASALPGLLKISRWHMSSANSSDWFWFLFLRAGMSLMKSEKSTGLSTDPWGTPHSIGWASETVSRTLTSNRRSLRNSWIHLTMWCGTLALISLYSNPLCHTLSNAAAMSKKTPHTRHLNFLDLPIFRLKLSSAFWTMNRMLSLVCLHLRNPDW